MEWKTGRKRSGNAKNFKGPEKGGRGGMKSGSRVDGVQDVLYIFYFLQLVL